MSSIAIVDQYQILLFGDLASDFEDELRELLHCRSHAALRSFIDAVGLAFRSEVATLSAEQKAWLPKFSTLVELVENMSGTIGSTAIRAGLLCFYQISRFILIDSLDSYPNPAACQVMGVCMGSFAAAAVAWSRTAQELILAGVEAALVAFRTGLKSLEMKRDLQSGLEDDQASWSAAIGLSDVEAQRVVNQFNDEANVSPSSQLYLSAVGTSTVTVSGLPSVLQRFVDSDSFKAHSIQIKTPYHAPHLYGSREVDDVMDRLRDDQLASYSRFLPLLSTASGAPVTADSFFETLKLAVEDTLCHQVRWDKSCQGIADLLKQQPDTIRSCVIMPVASHAATMLSSALHATKAVEVTISYALNTTLESTQSPPPTGRFMDEKIAILGYSGRFPEAASNDELWEVLMAARDCHRTIPSDRFDWESYYDASGKKKNHSRVKYGCFINEPGLFDARFFNMSPREAENTDPAQRLAIMSAYEAMEMAGMVPDRTPSTQCDRVGVFFGTTSDDWREVNSGQDVDTYFIPGGNRAFVPGRISYFFRFSGPSISIDTACSSSFAAIATACNALWQGDCDSALAGGTNVLTNPSNFVGLDRGHFLSIDGNCNPFDDTASGYCRADAVGVVVLKRLCDAIADEDPIMGVIAGAGTNHCGQTVSITRPHDGDQLSLFRRILRHTNTNPAEVGYVEMHGTGTQAGDAAEMRSVLAAFDTANVEQDIKSEKEALGGEEGGGQRLRRTDSHHSDRPPHPNHARHRRSRRRLPLYLGAVKANVGHSESASGVTALIKVLLMMRHSAIPPHRLNGVLNRNYPVDLAERNVHIAFQATPWRREDGVNGQRKAFLNNFSAAGGNTAVLLEDGPLPLRSRSGALPANDPRTAFPVAVSGRTIASIASNIQALADFLERNQDTDIASLSYTTTARRIHHRFRALAVGQNVDQIISALRRRANDKFRPIPLEPPRIAFAFTGQGNLYTGLGQHLFQHVYSFRTDLQRFDRLAVRHGFPSCLDIVAGDCSPEDLDSDPVRAQLVAVCVQMAMSRLWIRWQGQPSVVVGHSLGEYAALYAAGVLSAGDAIYLVGCRARLLSERCAIFTHGMLAIKAPLATVRSNVPATCEVACINSPTSFVVAGPKQEVSRLAEILRSLNIETVPLNVPFAFHSAHVEPILSDFEAFARGVRYHPPTVPYLSPLLSRVVTEPDVLDAIYLKNATRNHVDFQGAIEAARQSGTINESTLWVELGPHPACSGMIKQTLNPDVLTVPLLRKGADTWKVIVAALEAAYQAGAEVKWDEFHRGFDLSHSIISLPAYQWDLRNYWINYEPHSCSTTVDSPEPTVPLSSSIHRVLNMDGTGDSCSLLAESDLHESRLFPIFSGHKVNGSMLCPSSLYADMATTCARYMLRSTGRLNDSTGIDCSDMNVQQPFIARSDATCQLIRLSAQADWTRKEIKMLLFSVSDQAQKIADHAICTVRITENPEWAREWRSQAYLITTRIATLSDGVASGSASKLDRAMAYTLFGKLVDYSREYQGMEQVLLNSHLLEASATVKFQIDDHGFETNPCWIDSLGHIAGFIMNANCNNEMRDQVFVNHGWESMRCTKPFEAGKTYTTYNRMQQEAGTLYSGDTFVFDSDELIAVFKRVKFQGIPRSVLNRLLPPDSAGKSASGQMAATAVARSRPHASAGKSALAATSVDVGRQAGQLKGDGGDRASSTSTTPSLTHSIITPALTSPASGDEGLSDFDSLDQATPSSLNIMSIIRNVLSQEIGAPPEDLLPNASLAELGVDSLLALTVSGALAEMADLTLPSDLFVKNHTLGDVENALIEAGLIKRPTETTAVPVTQKEMGSPEHERQPQKTSRLSVGGPVDEPSATSVLLQGNPRTTKTVLFLLPDGAGSATTYQFIPTISPDVTVFGLNCPWMKKPEQLQCSLEHYVANLLVEIRRRQPHGPYHLGGASAGGILAYEAAQQLARANERCATLIFIDVPNPIGLQSPNERFYEFLEQQGMFGMATSRDLSWLRPHFMAFVKMLDAYEAQPFGGASSPVTHLVYAEDGICKSETDARPELRPDDPREMRWLLNNRTDFSGAGWKQVLGSEKLRITTLSDVNHFTIMQNGPKMEVLRALIAKALGGR